MLHVECKQIRHLDEFEKAAKDIQRHVFDIAHGETARLVFLSRSPREHYLILGFFKLILDGEFPSASEVASELQPNTRLAGDTAVVSMLWDEAETFIFGDDGHGTR